MTSFGAFLKWKLSMLTSLCSWRMSSEYLLLIIYSYFIKYASPISQSTNSRDWVLWNHITNAVQTTFFPHKYLNINNKELLLEKNTHQSRYRKCMFYFVCACSMCFTPQKSVRFISYNYITLELYPCSGLDSLYDTGQYNGSDMLCLFFS